MKRPGIANFLARVGGPDPERHRADREKIAEELLAHTDRPSVLIPIDDYAHNGDTLTRTYFPVAQRGTVTLLDLEVPPLRYSVTFEPGTTTVKAISGAFNFRPDAKPETGPRP